MKSLFEEMGGTHRQIGDYRLPDLDLPKQKPFFFGRYGRLRKEYLKNHRKVLFTNLLTSGKLDEHLADIDKQANDMITLLIQQMAANQGVTERLKAENQLLWVGRMNNIKHSAEELVLHELVYT